MNYKNYTLKLGEMPVDSSKHSLSENCLVKYSDKLWKVSFLLTQKSEKLNYDVVDTLMLDNIAGSDGITLTYWTDYDKQISVLLNENLSAIKADSFLNPSLVAVDPFSLWPKMNDGVSNDPILSKIKELLDNKNTYTAGSYVSDIAPRHSWPAVKTNQSFLVQMEKSDSEENKFWSAWIDQSSKGNFKVSYYYGKIGTNGSYGVYRDGYLSNLEDAKALLKTKVKEKEVKGYKYILKGI